MKRATGLLLLVLAALLLGCGGSDGPTDERVADSVDGSGEPELLANPVFRQAVEGIGVNPGRRPVAALGRAIGRRMRAVVVDSGRLAPASFSPPYRGELERRGRLTRAQFNRHYGDGPLELADRVGRITGLLDVMLDEGADPAPALPRAVLAGYGHVRREGEVKPAGAAVALRDRINGLFPEADPRLQCASAFRSSYVFVASVYDSEK